MTPPTRRITSERRVTGDHVELGRFHFSGNLDVQTLAVYPMLESVGASPLPKPVEDNLLLH